MEDILGKILQWKNLRFNNPEDRNKTQKDLVCVVPKMFNQFSQFVNLFNLEVGANLKYTAPVI